ncbi:MAG: methyltransferase family protein [Bacillota bacterium]
MVNTSYGLWMLVLIDSLIFIIFAFSFTRPKTTRDWRSLGAFSAFVVALFTEMYGFPLTIYLLSGWLGSRFPGLDLFSHDRGHIWYTILGLEGDPHTSIIHLLSNLLIFMGLVLIAKAWKVLHQAQRNHQLATSGLYAYVRHPQYAAFLMVMIGFLIQWPTLLTITMFPVLVWISLRLARQEESMAIAEFGEEYVQYASVTPAFLPRFGSLKGANSVLK